MPDIIQHALSDDGGIRIYAADTTETVNTAQRIHGTWPVATAALGRLLTAAAMMGSMTKGEKDSITLQIKGDGPIGGITAMGNSKAQVKGYVVNPHVRLPDRIPGKLNVGGAVGGGTLGVIMDMGLKKPYMAQTELVSGEIAEDLTAYYAISEQIPTAIALGVMVDTDGSVIRAGGYIVQLMPGCPDSNAERLEKTIASLPPVTTMLCDNISCEDLILAVTAGFNMLIYNETITPQYHCDCSRERVRRALISMGVQEMEELIREQGAAELTCQFCDRIYDFSKSELLELTQYMKSQKKH